ncbi:MAG: hypothetical protein HOP02_00770 [Methylococcaceae bacterium]|nr:hypothetical protein [Methylococcaceae bacterium]
MNPTNFLKTVFTVSCFCFPPSSLADKPKNNAHRLPEVACRYETTVTPLNKSKAPSKHTWFFWRTPEMIQTLDADGDYGEIWQRTVTGSIQYRKLYPSDKTAVEYMPADNPTNNLSFEWGKLSNMLSQQELEALKPVKNLQVMGRNAQLRKGKIDGQTVAVQWLTNENLPASIIKKNSAGTMELRLVAIQPLVTANRKPIAIEAIANYRHIDAIDFGDMENDPFVKKVLAAEGGHHH